MRNRAYLFPALLALGALLYWLLPISGRLTYVPESVFSAETYPHITVEREDEALAVVVRDVTPWTFVRLETDNGSAELVQHGEQDRNGLWLWRWDVTDTEQVDALELFHSCSTGCQAWGSSRSAPEAAPDTTPARTPTKLGVVLANKDRDWHGRQGWDVEITYAKLADEEFWGVDDLANRVRLAQAKGLRVLVRVEYDQGQSLPAPNDAIALDDYLRFAERLARDVRLQQVHGFIIGSNFNTNGGNSQAPDNPVTPEWYARVFNGYGLDPLQQDNAVEVIKRENAQARVIAGPVNPWNQDRNATPTYEIDVPWLNYMFATVQLLDEGARAKAEAGVGSVAPDGFAIQAFGRVADHGAQEPLTNLNDDAFPGAQMGFRIFEDWLAIINRFDHTRGKPVYINATNTFDPLSGSLPAENYPAGWLTNAYAAVNAEPQIEALCWFIDGFVHDEQWAMFSLIEPRGSLAVAATEFETLLQLDR